MDFEARPATTTVEVMKREAAAILRSAGVALDWRALSENRGTEAFSGLVVLRFKGECRVNLWDDAPVPSGTPVTLGTTLVSGGRVLPFSEVECDQVRKLMRPAEPGAAQQERQGDLGRALGRVVAHELYHVLARTTGHAANGLAKATQSVTDLVTAPLKLGEADAAAIRKLSRPTP